MKNIFLTITLILIVFSCSSQKSLPRDKEMNVIFIGNSLTYYNDMPQILQQIFTTQKVNFKISQSTYPGISLTQHLNRKAVVTEKGTNLTPLENGDTSTTVKILNSKKWDFVVLQNGTVGFLIPEVKTFLVIPAIQKFKEIINNKETKIILFKTWPNKDTLPKQYCYPSAVVDNSITKENCCSPLIKTTTEEANLINNAYDSTAVINNIATLPITDCFMDIINNYPEINLYQDNSHPSKLGAYLNACLFYKYFTKQKATSIKYTADIDIKTVHIIQKVVDKYLK